MKEFILYWMCSYEIEELELLEEEYMIEEFVSNVLRIEDKEKVKRVIENIKKFVEKMEKSID